MILGIETISNRMWSPEETIVLDGWVLQFAGGYTRRPNSVNLLTRSTLPIADKIAVCVEEYERRGLPTIFKIVPQLQKDNAVEVLEAHGFLPDPNAINCVQTRDLNTVDEVDTVNFFDHYTDEWMAAFTRMKDLSPYQEFTHAKILHRIPFPTCYCYVERDGKIVAVGLGVASERYYGIYDVVTDADYRGQGLGREMMAQLLAQGKALGAQTAFLQMDTNNLPAQKLYQSCGFTEAYRYFYHIAQ